ncbi:MAG TPA: CPBP family intramembrane metalloprotease [Methanomicrobia archaeon]|nr:CPBP family intramembrane metalloprotease [Methanomicrobia archaeon]
MGKRRHQACMLVVCVTLILIMIEDALPTSSFDGFIFKEFVLYLAIPLVVAYALRRSVRPFGIALGDRKKVARYAMMLYGIGIPFMIVGSRMSAFRSYYPRFSFGSWEEFIYWELMIGILMLSTEFLFRGFLMFGCKRAGRWAILLQAVPYAYIHLGKPMLEVYYSFFAGLAFGYIDWESKSIFPSFLVHWCASVTFDILCMV